MKENILILGVRKFKNDKGLYSTRLSFIFAKKDKMCLSENYKGFIDLAQYYDGTDVFDLLPNEIIGEVVEATLDIVPNRINPLKQNTIITSINFNNKVYKLCL